MIGSTGDNPDLRISRRQAIGRTSLMLAVPALAGAASGSADPHGSETRATSATPASGSPDDAFTRFADRYFDGFFHYSPDSATNAGIHDYDSELPVYSRQVIESEISRNRQALGQLGKIPRAKLSSGNQIDYPLLESALRARLLELEKIRAWEKDPNFYNDISSGALFSLVRRDFAPVDDRLRALIARERQVPGILASARANVSNPPPVFVKVAIAQVQAQIGFMKDDLPKALAGAQNAALKAEFETVNRQAIDAYGQFLDYLEKDLTARAHGNFAIGEANYREKLLYDEMVDTPIDRLLRIGRTELRKTQAAFLETAKLIDPAKAPLDVLQGLAKDHPDAASLLSDVQSILGGLRDFVVSHDIVTIPPSPAPQVVETPPFMRALTFASMDTPGPFEKSTEAFYNVTLPDPAWSDAQREQLLEAFSRDSIRVTSIHEVYPGHYVEFLRQKQTPSKVRKLAGLLHQPWGEIGSNGEGWAHYSEQMMLEQGYGEGDPKLLLFQLQAALERLCRYIVGISLHTRGMTLDQATDFFQSEGYMERSNAEREAMRGTSDPTYLVYTLGKLEILKLREDYKAKLGDKFSLKDFHDHFLSFGVIPIKLIREQMLGPGSGGILPS